MKPVAGKLFYNPDTDRPRVSLRSGDVDLLVDGDAGAITEVESADSSITVTNGTGPTVDLAVATTPAITETSGPTILTIDDIADGEYLRRSGSTVVGGSLVAATSNFWWPPASPHADDAEFNDSTLPGAFTLWSVSGGSATAISPGSGNPDIFTTPAGNPRVAANMARRPSWICFQGPASNTFYLYSQTVTLSATLVIKTRLFSVSNYSSATNNRGFIALAVAKDDGGVPHVDASGLYTAVQIGWEPDAGVFQLEWITRVSGAASVSRATGTDLDATLLTPDSELVLVFMPGTNSIWQAWVKGNSISHYLGQINLGAAIGLNGNDTAHVGWQFSGTSSIDVGNSMGTPVSGADYLRFDTTFLP